MKPSISKQRPVPRPAFLAGNLALDFLNTRMRVGDRISDLLQSDEDVLRWLEKAGLPASKAAANLPPHSLLRDARALRENVRSLIEQRKIGRRGDVAVLNRFLHHAISYPRLVWTKPHSPSLERVRQQEDPEAILAPVAEAAAVLLTAAEFSLVKRCEGDRCVLWFCDQTRSHRRRWCSSKICGNRHKVAAYRKRLREPAH